MKIGIIGFGNFGQLAVSILVKEFRANCLIFDLKESEERRKIADRLGAKFTDLKTTAECDVVILAVPISKTERTIKLISGFLKPKTLVVDACSVKTLPCRWMKKSLPGGVEILGAHPMFGPTSAKFDSAKLSFELNGLQLVLCPVRISTKKVTYIKKAAEKLGLKVIVTTAENHDRQNAYTLSLVHFLGRSLKRAGVKEQEIFTPGYRELLKILPHTNSDNWQLFYDMNNYNPYAKQAREKFIEATRLMEEKITRAKEKDDLAFYRSMIDNIDMEMIDLLSKRFKLSKKIGEFKREQGVEIADKKREDEIIKKRTREAKMNSGFVKKLYKLIFDESYKKQ